MAIGPTEKQLKLLKFIKKTVKKRGVSPTVREMQTNAHLKSTAAIFSMLRRMHTPVKPEVLNYYDCLQEQVF